jgi:2-polyprenyl-3-methyl-5-hydroxy-6-metoxy-1,4-benzoquinol methylase
VLSAQKLPFLRRMIRHRLSGRHAACPYCGGTRLRRVARKRLVLDVYECGGCLLLFRWPMETEEEFRRFYQAEYHEGAITDLPSEERLAEMSEKRFAGTSLDLSSKIALLRGLQPSGRLLDYGCSWGYGVFQLRAAGYDAAGYEISLPRAEYARRWLGGHILDDPAALDETAAGSFDVVFSNHVVEHLPELGRSLELFARLLRPQGLLFTVLPNFSGREARNGRFLNWIGEAHPIAPTRDFFLKNLPNHGFRDVHSFSGPFTDAVVGSAVAGKFTGLDQDGDELLVLARKEG